MAKHETLPPPPPPAPLPPPTSVRSFLDSDVYYVGFFEETDSGLTWRNLDRSRFKWLAQRKLRRHKNVPGVQIADDYKIAATELRTFRAARYPN